MHAKMIFANFKYMPALYQILHYINMNEVIREETNDHGEDVMRRVPRFYFNVKELLRY